MLKENYQNKNITHNMFSSFLYNIKLMTNNQFLIYLYFKTSKKKNYIFNKFRNEVTFYTCVKNLNVNKEMNNIL